MCISPNCVQHTHIQLVNGTSGLLKSEEAYSIKKVTQYTLECKCKAFDVESLHLQAVVTHCASNAHRLCPEVRNVMTTRLENEVGASMHMVTALADEIYGPQCYSGPGFIVRPK